MLLSLSTVDLVTRHKMCRSDNNHPKRERAFALIVFALICFAQAQQPGGQEQNSPCLHDRDALLSLDYESFDQDFRNDGGGWRKVANRPGCVLEAADLIRDYRVVNRAHDRLLYWHEGQLRALVSQYLQAINLFEQTRYAGQDDWNAYVDATIAFLENDKDALLDAHERLLAIEPPDDDTLNADGYIEVFDNTGKRILFRWPLNIEVVEQLLTCFDLDYRELDLPMCTKRASEKHP